MKKALSLLLVLVLCLSLCACGKSEAVKSVEAMIDALLGSTEYNVEQIEAIYTAFAELSEKEQKRVGNYDDFIKVSDDFYASALIGTWCPFEQWAGGLENYFSPDFYIVLNADNTFESVAGEEGTTTGTWEVKNKCLTLLGLKELRTMNYGTGGKEDISLSIRYEDGFVCLENDSAFCKYYKEDDYFSILGDVLLAVDCANVDLSDYFGFTTFEAYPVDEWGVRTGSTYTEVILQNLLYEDGWMYFGKSDNFMLEVLYPDYTEVFYFPDGSTRTSEYPAGSENISYCPFSANMVNLPVLSQQTKDGSAETNLSTDAFTFGRAKGSLYFVNSKYVKDVRKSEDDRRVLVIDTSQKFASLVFAGDSDSERYVGQWEEGNLEY